MDIHAKDAMTGWKQAVSLVKQHGSLTSDERKTIEILNLLITIENTDHITAPIDYLGQAKQWVYPSVREIQDIILAKASTLPYGYSYGAKIFGLTGKKDQIHQYIIPLLKENPHTRRACVIVTDPEDGLMHAQNMSSVLAIDFKMRNNKLHSTMFIRSSDVFIGWPANIYQLFSLTEYVAARIDAQIGTLTTLATSAHLFDEYEEHIKKLLSR